ncbi:MAG: FG-GAP repeat protein [Planctomycetes bacterium]|nr:FG-GAP repeat protein [Planctomycetota bacterium]
MSSASHAALSYSGLVVQDAAKRTLPATMHISANRLSIVIDESEARYPLLVDPVAQQAYIKASNTGPDDRFGCAVAVSGDTAIVGAFLEDSNATGVNGDGNNNSATNSGAAYVFVRNGTTWTQQAYLKASNTGANDQFGFSVAISGDVAVVGANLEDSASTGVNGMQSDNSAASSGAAYVFVRNGTTWTQEAYLKASNTGSNDFFGASVAVSGDVIAVGAHLEDSAATGVDGDGTNNVAADSGAVYMFERQGSTWMQSGYIKASNTGASDQFGSSVALSMDTLVVGASNEDSNAVGVNGNQSNDGAGNSGAAYVFVRAGASWSQQAYLKASNTGLFDEFGHDVAISGSTILVGARLEDSGAIGVNGDQASNSVGDSGAAYVFVRNGGTWQQQAYLKASNTGIGDQFGFSVSISGDSAVVGAVAEDSNAIGINGDGINNASISAGSAYVFVRSGTVWSQSTYLKASNTGGNDQFGHSVAISGDVVFVSALGEASSATGINGNQLNNSIPNAGAAYVFDLDQHAGATQFGSGTPGCAGPHTLSEAHAPMIGSPNFQLRCSAAPPSSLGLGLVSDVMSLAGVDSFGIGALLHVDLLASTEIITLDFVSDILGAGTGAAPIPNDPLLIGKSYHCAVIWVWSSCSLPPFGISSSNGLTLTIQVP